MTSTNQPTIDPDRVCVICDGDAYITDQSNEALLGNRVDCPAHGVNSGRPRSSLNWRENQS